MKEVIVMDHGIVKTNTSKLLNHQIQITIIAIISLPYIAFGSENISYTYNNAGELTKVDYGGSTTIEYVYDGAGNRLAQTTSLVGTPPNSPPNAPSNVNPVDGMTAVNLNPLLTWNSNGDPDATDIVFFDVYLGTTSPPPLYKNGHNSTSITPLTLEPQTTYYWKISARDNHNSTFDGPIWSFTTANN
jgi:YD repeat-containing protein